MKSDGRFGRRFFCGGWRATTDRRKERMREGRKGGWLLTRPFLAVILDGLLTSDLLRDVPYV